MQLVGFPAINSQSQIYSSLTHYFLKYFNSTQFFPPTWYKCFYLPYITQFKNGVNHFKGIVQWRNHDLFSTFPQISNQSCRHGRRVMDIWHAPQNPKHPLCPLTWFQHYSVLKGLKFSPGRSETGNRGWSSQSYEVSAVLGSGHLLCCKNVTALYGMKPSYYI